MRFRALAVLLAAGLSAGCVQTSVVGLPDYNALYSRDMVSYAGTSGEIAAVVMGNPFGPAVSDEQIMSQIPTPAWVSARRFTTNPGAQTPWSYRVVLIFNPARPGAGDDLTCANPAAEPTGGTRGDGRARVVAVFCADSRWASQLEGSVPLDGGPGSPAFRTAMQTVMADLLPPVNPKVDRGDNAIRVN